MVPTARPLLMWAEASCPQAIAVNAVHRNLLGQVCAPRSRDAAARSTGVQAMLPDSGRDAERKEPARPRASTAPPVVEAVLDTPSLRRNQ
jgi:hypothetical protein